MLAFLVSAAAQTGGARGEDVFVDVSKTVGLNVRHVNGARGAKLLPETINGGAGWFDYDGDGHLDLYLVQGHGDSTRAYAPGDTGNRLLLYLRDRRLVSAQLERACSARDYYSGFYFEPNDDGRLCIERDRLLSRTGARCSLSNMAQLVPVSGGG